MSGLRVVVGHPGSVRRTGLLIAGWALATLLALILGLQGVSAISDSVTSHQKASLSPVSVRAALDRSTASSSDGASSGESSSASSDSTAVASSSAASSASDDHGGQAESQAPPPPDDQSSSSGDGTESHGSSASAEPEDRTYQLVGGSVGVRFENGAAHLLWATPAAGFSVESNGGSSSVDVRFQSESDNHESRLKAFWNAGPQQEIEEKD